MKKFSVVVPVYNEENLIVACLERILNQQYPKEFLEVIVVNDASTDRTKERIKGIMSRYPDRIILLNHPENKGRMKARLAGGVKARYGYLVFVDSRVEIAKDFLGILNTCVDKIIIAGDAGLDLKRNNISYFFYLLRRKIYGGVYPQKERIMKINLENFDNVPKGTTACMFEKDLFLKVMAEVGNQGKDVSDDTKLFRLSLKYVPYLVRNNDVKYDYFVRDDFFDLIKHTFNRGPKFVDFYFVPGRRYFYHLIVVFFTTILLPFGFVLDLQNLLGIFFILNFLVVIFLSVDIRSFLISFIYFPVIASAFYLGLLKGFLLKIGCRRGRGKY